MGTSWNRLFNYQRDALVKLPVWTTEEDRQRALSYVDRQFIGVSEVIEAAQKGRSTPDLGVFVAAARYEDAGWMPDGCFEQWRRWVLGDLKAEKLTVPELVQWLGDVEHRIRQGA